MRDLGFGNNNIVPNHVPIFFLVVNEEAHVKEEWKIKQNLLKLIWFINLHFEESKIREILSWFNFPTWDKF